jgi:hypothetical protein
MSGWLSWGAQLGIEPARAGAGSRSLRGSFRVRRCLCIGMKGRVADRTKRAGAVCLWAARVVLTNVVGVTGVISTGRMFGLCLSRRRSAAVRMAKMPKSHGVAHEAAQGDHADE